MNDILKQINLRMANPFIFSFCIAWVFINWRIVVGLLWYSGDTISDFGYKSHADLIESNSDCRYLLLKPSIYALTYIVLIPLIKWGSGIYATWINKYESSHLNKVAQGSYVIFSRYFKILDDNTSLKTKLTEMINNETAITAELQNTISTKDKEIADIKKQTATLLSYSYRNNLDGHWRFININKKVEVEVSSESELRLEYLIRIENSKIFKNESDENLAEIKSYVYSNVSNLIAIELINVVPSFLPFANGYYFFVFHVEIEKENHKISRLSFGNERHQVELSRRSS